MKKILALILALALVFSFAACSKKDEGEKETLYDSIPDKPFNEIILQTISQINRIDDVGKPSCGISTDETGSDTECDQKRNHSD